MVTVTKLPKITAEEAIKLANTYIKIRNSRTGNNKFSEGLNVNMFEYSRVLKERLKTLSKEEAKELLEQIKNMSKTDKSICDAYNFIDAMYRETTNPKQNTIFCHNYAEVEF